MNTACLQDLVDDEGDFEGALEVEVSVDMGDIEVVGEGTQAEEEEDLLRQAESVQDAKYSSQIFHGERHGRTLKIFSENVETLFARTC